jgi:hypothetical protein
LDTRPHSRDDHRVDDRGVDRLDAGADLTVGTMCKPLSTVTTTEFSALGSRALIRASRRMT